VIGCLRCHDRSTPPDSLHEREIFPLSAECLSEIFPVMEYRFFSSYVHGKILPDID
jgi:hypothetical protein